MCDRLTQCYDPNLATSQRAICGSLITSNPSLSRSEFSRSREFIHLKRVGTDPQVIPPESQSLSSECKRRSRKKKHKQSYPNNRVPPPNASEGLGIINELPITFLVSTHMIMFHGNEIIAQLHLDDRRSAKGLRTHSKD